ncbi:hypothetical protein O3P69_016959 [Scylla paramamosain]|uniref:Pro-resilin-like n=1 Tax=Scylla paramamosain TaxID=85552 RepID=A0AAW0TTV1_SCYPA
MDVRWCQFSPAVVVVVVTVAGFCTAQNSASREDSNESFHPSPLIIESPFSFRPRPRGGRLYDSTVQATGVKLHDTSSSHDSRESFGLPHSPSLGYSAPGISPTLNSHGSTGLISSPQQSYGAPPRVSPAPSYNPTPAPIQDYGPPPPRPTPGPSYIPPSTSHHNHGSRERLDSLERFPSSSSDHLASSSTFHGPGVGSLSLHDSSETSSELFLRTSGQPRPNFAPQVSASQPQTSFVGAFPNYYFNYNVHDPEEDDFDSLGRGNKGPNFGHSERREGGRTEGRYYVELPDGRTQVVEYYADETGYHPTITYI